MTAFVEKEKELSLKEQSLCGREGQLNAKDSGSGGSLGQNVLAQDIETLTLRTEVDALVAEKKKMAAVISSLRDANQVSIEASTKLHDEIEVMKKKEAGRLGKETDATKSKDRQLKSPKKPSFRTLAVKEEDEDEDDGDGGPDQASVLVKPFADIWGDFWNTLCAHLGVDNNTAIIDKTTGGAIVVLAFALLVIYFMTLK